MSSPALRMPPLADDEMSEEQREILKDYAHEGRLFNVFRVFIRNVPLFKRHQVFAHYIMRKSHLPPADREIAILRIGRLNRSEYEWAHHAWMGREAGLSDEKIEAIAMGPDAEGLTDFEAALITAVDQLKFDAQLTDEIYQKLASRYDEKQLIDLVMTVGNYNMVSTGLNVFGVPLEDGFAGFPA